MISIMYFRFLVDHGYYRDIVYRNNLKNTIKTYRDITFSIIAQPYLTYIHIIMFYSPTGYVGFLLNCYQLFHNIVHRMFSMY